MREVAAQTGTLLVVSYHGVIEKIAPGSAFGVPTVQEPKAGYGDRA